MMMRRRRRMMRIVVIRKNLFQPQLRFGNTKNTCVISSSTSSSWLSPVSSPYSCHHYLHHHHYHRHHKYHNYLHLHHRTGVVSRKIEVLFTQETDFDENMQNFYEAFIVHHSRAAGATQLLEDHSFINTMYPTHVHAICSTLQYNTLVYPTHVHAESICSTSQYAHCTYKYTQKHKFTNTHNVHAKYIC